jgi:plastocyanin
MAGQARSTSRRAASFLATALASFLAASVIGGCSGSAQGLDRPPASLDPGSPILVAEAITFDRTDLAVAAGGPFVLILENRDTVSHNVSIYADDQARDRRFEGVLFGGPGTRWYPVPALAPGSYLFLCDLHPSMRGTLTAT